MKFELTKDLNDAGFPLKAVNHTGPTQLDEGFVFIDKHWLMVPNLAQLIEECGEIWFTLVCMNNKRFVAHKEGEDHKNDIDASTPEEAIARLWLALNKKA